MLLDKLRNLFFQALRFDGDDATMLVSRWNEEIDYIQSVFDNMTNKKSEPPIRTNADRLDAMTVEEKAEFLSELKYAPSCDSRCHKNIELYGEPRTCCEECWFNWLKQEVKG